MEAAEATSNPLKTQFIESLERPYELNAGDGGRTKLLDDVIDAGGGIANPGSAFAAVAPGVWRGTCT